MSDKVLVAYATVYGSTREVAEAVAATLQEEGVDADLCPAQEARDLSGYDAVVLGAPLINHHFHKDARGFLARNRKTLERLKVAVFALGPVHEDPKEWEECQGQLEQELAGLDWLNPVAAELLGGKFDPELLRWPLNKFAASAGASDVRDWDAIRAWASKLPELLEPPLAVS